MKVEAEAPLLLSSLSPPAAASEAAQRTELYRWDGVGVVRKRSRSRQGQFSSESSLSHGQLSELPKPTQPKLLPKGLEEGDTRDLTGQREEAVTADL